MVVAKTGGPTSTLVTRKQSHGGIAVDASYVYWSDAESNTISKVSRNGGSPIAIAGGVSAVYLAVDSTHLYAAIYEPNGGIQRIPLRGGAPETVATQPNANSIVLDAVSFYWTATDLMSQGSVMKTPLSGGPSVMLARTASVRELALANNALFWIENGEIKKVSTAGGSTSTVALNQADFVSVAADNTHVYWVSSDVYRASTSSGEQELVVNNKSFGSALTLDETDVYWIAAGQINKFRK